MRSFLPMSADDSTPSLLVAMGLSEPPLGKHPSWLLRALSNVSVMWPLFLAVRLCIFLMLCGTTAVMGLAEHPVRGGLLAGLFVLVDGAIIVVPRLGKFRDYAPHLRMRMLVPLILLSALSYSLLCREMAPQGGMAVLFATTLPATVAVSIFGAQRVLAFVYCLGCLVPLAISWPDSLPWTVLTMMLAVMLFFAVAQARADQSFLTDRQRSTLLSEQARALLTDFEEAGQGWFWETDRNGRLTYISDAVARKIGAHSADLLGEPMTALIDQGARNNAREGQRTLGFHLSARTAFSEVMVRAAVEEEMWWSLSGRPVHTEFGQFLGFRGSGADLTEMRKSQAEVTRLARFDSLTGLANRVQMMATLEQTITGEKGQGALFLLDLDRFKAVNDTMGHPAGDALLRQVAQRLLRAIGNAGSVGRLGGDEFQVVLPGSTDRAELAKLAEAVIHSVSQPYAINEAQMVIGVSIGIAVAPFDGSDADTLIRNADLALYDAKDAGRGTHRFYSEEMHADAEDRRRMEQDLRHAINTGGLHVEYQPVVSTASEKISGFEALVRWTHPQRGAISPAVFVPLAEEAGLIAAIGEWVLRTACTEAVGWPEGTRVAVNVSPIQFANPAFPSQVMSALAKADLEPQRLELEITESVFMGEGADTDAMFAALKGLGVRLALDDFGTGYSALRYLRSAPFDKIKIDQSFVRGAAIRGSRNGAIVKSIVSLAEALQMETTAEGAETLDELELIRSLGCSHVQGFVYGRPARNEALLERFATQGLYVTASGHRASREPRRTMLRSIRLQHGAHSYEGRIRNISSGGALIEGVADVPPGTPFTLQLGPTETVEVTCRWSIDDRMGVEFVEPIQVDKTLGAESVRTDIRRKVA